jgi:hypothetical protein
MGKTKFQVKKYQAVRGMDGEAFNSELWIDGKLAVYANDGGFGGGMSWAWVDSHGNYAREDWAQGQAAEGLDAEWAPGKNDFVNPFVGSDDFARSNRDKWLGWKRQAMTLDEYCADDDCAFALWVTVAKSRGRSTFAIHSDGALYRVNSKPSAETFAFIRNQDPKAVILAQE